MIVPEIFSAGQAARALSFVAELDTEVDPEVAPTTAADIINSEPKSAAQRES
jgi:hypothetical protein